MSLVVAFNNLLVQFADELCKTLPDNQAVQVYGKLAKGVCTGESTLALDTFRKKVLPYEAKIMARDEQIFKDCPQLLGPSLDLAHLWESCLTPKNKEIFWEYMQALLLLSSQAGAPSGELVLPDTATALSSLPIPAPIADALSGIDMTDLVSIAQDIDQDDIQDIMGSVDPAALSALLTNFSPDNAAKIVGQVDQKKVAKILSKLDMTKVQRLVSQVDQNALLAALGGSKPKSKKAKK